MRSPEPTRIIASTHSSIKANGRLESGHYRTGLPNRPLLPLSSHFPHAFWHLSRTRLGKSLYSSRHVRPLHQSLHRVTRLCPLRLTSPFACCSNPVRRYAVVPPLSSCRPRRASRRFHPTASTTHP